MTDHHLARLSLADAAGLIRSQALKPADYVQALLSHISAREPQLHAFVSLTGDLAIEQADAAGQEVRAGNWKGPLHGVPYGLKDIIDYAGVATTAQSRLLDGQIAARDAGVVKRLKAQGAVLLGKLATDEFACGGHPTDSAWPKPVNPWHADYITAGSSSGSAVAVAACMLPASLGTDTAGSIRNPAARCGLVGMKPTYGRVSRAGVIPLAPSMDHVGPMTRTVRDNALVLQAIAGPDPDDPATLGQPLPDFLEYPSHLQGVKVAVARHVYTESPGCDPEHAAGIDKLVAALKDAGASIHEVRIDALDQYNRLSRLLLSVEAYAAHERFIKSEPGRYGSRCLARLLQGALLSAADYARLQQLRQRYVRDIDALLQSAELLVTASGYDATPRIDDHAAFLATYQRQARMPFNMSGHPALVLPTGFAHSTGMPLSAQIVGRRFAEASIYRAASLFEARHPWHDAYRRMLHHP